MVAARKMNNENYMNRELDKSWIVLGLFAAAIALFGGASRFDAAQIIPLRSVSALFLTVSLFFLTKEKIKSEGTLITFFGFLVFIVAIQLAPLPPSLWTSWSMRGDLLRLDVLLGLEGGWRPLTLAPMRTWNVFGSLIVPAAGLLVAIALSASSINLLRIIALLGCLNATLGLFQIVSGRSSAFYFYDITNRGSPVGIFANENHAAIFAACAMLVVAFLNLKVQPVKGNFKTRLIYFTAFILIFFVSLVGGSRAGFLAAIGAILVSFAMFFLSSRRRKGRFGSDAVHRWLDAYPRLVVTIPLIMASLTTVSFIALDRAPAVRDLLANDSFEDLRWSLWPVLREMLVQHWIAGAGFGSFEQVYHVGEPVGLLMPKYINQAHNDWAQFVIEGGVGAAALLAAILAWVMKKIGVLTIDPLRRVDGVFWMSIFAVFATASLIDYPLRTPLFQVIIVWLLLALSREGRAINAT